MARRRAVPRRRLSMTSLIDVIFLLLLFFMLSSTFSRFAEIPLTAAAGGAEGGARRTVFVQLGASRIAVNGAPTSLDGLARAIGDGQGPRVAILSVGDGVAAQRLADLLVTLRAIPELSVTVLAPS